MARPVAIASLLALALTGAVFATTALTPANRGLDFDGVFYAAMAGHPQVKPEFARVSPWAYRVATPAVVSLLPFETLTSFRAVVFAANAASLVLVFLILRNLGFDAARCAIGVLLYAGVFWTLKFPFRSPAYIDAETQLVLLAIIYLVQRDLFVALIGVMAIAVLQKESLAAFSLFAVAALVRKHGPRLSTTNALVAAALVGVPILTITIVRATVPIANAIDTSAETQEQLRLLLTAGYWPVLLHSSFSGLGLLWVVMALRPRRWLAFAREHWEWLIYLVIAVVFLFGGRDKGRLFLSLVPAAVVFSVMAIDDLKVLRNGARGLAWLALLLVAHAYLGNYLTPIGDGPDVLARLVPEHSDTSHLPYLWRNLAIAAVVAGFALVTGGQEKHRQEGRSNQTGGQE